MFDVGQILDYISMFLALLLVLPLHEFAHGFAAVKNGDITPKLYNRYTINPFAHFDAMGLLCFLFAGFGWAKPVPVNPSNFNNYKKGCFYVSIAGVAANYLLAIVAYPLFILVILYVPQFGYFTQVLYMTLLYIYRFSLSFFVFNLIPVYPLDGFRVVDVFSKRRSQLYWFLRTKGIYVLYGLFALSIFADMTNLPQLDILGNVLSFLVGFIEKPITLFWNLIIFGV